MDVIVGQLLFTLRGHCCGYLGQVQDHQQNMLQLEGYGEKTVIKYTRMNY